MNLLCRFGVTDMHYFDIFKRLRLLKRNSIVPNRCFIFCPPRRSAREDGRLLHDSPLLRGLRVSKDLCTRRPLPPAVKFLPSGDLRVFALNHSACVRAIARQSLIYCAMPPHPQPFSPTKPEAKGAREEEAFLRFKSAMVGGRGQWMKRGYDKTVESLLFI